MALDVVANHQIGTARQGFLDNEIVFGLCMEIAPDAVRGHLVHDEDGHNDDQDAEDDVEHDGRGIVVVDKRIEPLVVDALQFSLQVESGQLVVDGGDECLVA